MAPAAVALPATHALAAAKPQPHGLGIRLAEAPTNRRDDPRAYVYIVDHVAQGATIQRKVEVTNTTQQTLNVRLYGGDATISGGEFRPSAAGAAGDIGDWTSVTPSSLTLRPGAHAFPEVTLTVPRDAPDGERYGVIWAEVPAPPGSGVRLAARVGVRVYLSVGEGAEPVSNFTINSLTADRDSSGRPIVQAQVRNTGERALDMSGKLVLEDGPGGLHAGPFPAELGTTLGIGQTEPVTVVLDKSLPAGPWHARITLQSGRIKHTAQATIRFPAGAGQLTFTATPVTGRRLPTLWLFAGGGVLLLLLLLLLLRRRRRRDERKRVGRHVGVPSPAQVAWTVPPVTVAVPLQRPDAEASRTLVATSPRSRGKGRHRD